MRACVARFMICARHLNVVQYQRLLVPCYNEVITECGSDLDGIFD